jgi:hypothetical protein
VGHEVWLWLWFTVGSSIYWVKRAYYLVTGPSPIANNYHQFIQRCWIPIGIRFAVNSGIFWFLFTPGAADKALNYLGWSNFAWVVQMVTQFAVFAWAFGLSVDVISDFALSKIPILKDWLPQMPGPLSTPEKP